MKKLLALILCLVMVLSLAPAAFAAGTTGGEAAGYRGDREPAFVDAAIANKAISDLNKDMNALYTAFAADQLVFDTAKAVYSMTDGLSKELLKDLEKLEFFGMEIYQEDLMTNLRQFLNGMIGNEIANYMNDRIDAYTNGDGNIQPDKYLNTFVKAFGSTLGSEKAQKNLQWLVYGVAAIKLQVDMNDKADDLYTAIVDWDHWNEFNWGDIANLDPSVLPLGMGYYATWLPTDATLLIPTGSGETLGDAAAALIALTGFFPG